MAPRVKTAENGEVLRRDVSAAVRRDGVRELSHAPQPFLDWSLVETGAVSWVNARGEPVTDPETPEEKILPAQMGAPLGIRLAVQPGVKAGPLFPDEKAWEAGLLPGSSAFADDDLYRLWYYSPAGMLYAQSADGAAWTRPLIDFVPFQSFTSTNLLPPMEGVNGRAISPFEGTIFADPHGKEEERYKAIFPGRVTAEELTAFEAVLGPASPTARAKRQALFGATSPDGFTWVLKPKPLMLHASDVPPVVNFDSALKRYVCYLRGIEPGRRTLGRAESENFWAWPLPLSVFAPDPAEGPGVEVLTAGYAPYPGNRELKLMFPTVYDAARDRTEIRLVASRDGVVWHQVPGGPLLGPGEAGAFDAGSLVANQGLLYTTDQQLALRYSGSNRPLTYPRTLAHQLRMGSALWREERLGALEASERGEFTTIPLLLRGSAIELNVQTDRVGELRLELRDRHFRPIQGRAFADADSLSGDHLWTPATWRGNADLQPLIGQIVYLRFRLRAARLFAIRAAR